MVNVLPRADETTGTLKPLVDRIAALSRLKEISDQLIGLRSNLSEFPANSLIIDKLLEDRKYLMKLYIYSVPAYP